MVFQLVCYDEALGLSSESIWAVHGFYQFYLAENSVESQIIGCRLNIQQLIYQISCFLLFFDSFYEIDKNLAPIFVCTSLATIELKNASFILIICFKYSIVAGLVC